MGNTLRGDDGLGYCVATALERCGGLRGARLARVQTLSPGHFTLLEDSDTVVFIDAVLDPGMPPDARVAVLHLDPRQLSPGEVAELIQATDPHGMDPLRLTVMAYAAGVFNGEAYVVGVRPSRIEFMEGLSGEVLASLPRLLEELEKLLKRLGVEMPDPGCVIGWVRGNCRGPVLD